MTYEVLRQSVHHLVVALVCEATYEVAKILVYHLAVALVCDL